MIVGLSGYARTGKDTVAGILIEHYGFERRAFADVLRQSIYRLNPMTGNTVRVANLVDEYGWEVAKANPEVRRLLQVMGTEVGRELFGADVWVKQAMKDLPERTVFTDLRFPNEATAIRKRGGTVWRVSRPDVDAINGHESERAMDNYAFDAWVKNDSNIDYLRHQVAFIMEAL